VTHPTGLRASIALPVCPPKLNEQAEEIHDSFARHRALIRCACNDSECNDKACNELALQGSVITRKTNLLQKVMATKAKTPAPN